MAENQATAENKFESVEEELVIAEETNNTVTDSVDDTGDIPNNKHRNIVER